MTTEPQALILSAPISLSMGRDEPLKPIPIGLEGYPTEISVKVGDTMKTFPVAYFEKDVLETGRYADEKTNQEFEVTTADMDTWSERFNKMIAAGTEVPCPLDHSDKAEDNRGFTLRLRRDGNKLKATTQVFGEDGALMALRNRCSVKINPNYTDEKKRNWGNVIEHVSFTPVPVIGGQGPFVPIAASRGAQSGIPILYLSASKHKESEMDYTKLREAVGTNEAKSATDDALIQLVITELGKGKEAGSTLQLSRSKIDGFDAIEKRAKDAEAKVLELSHGTMDDATIKREIGYAIKDFDYILKDGKCSAVHVDTIKSWIADNAGNPTPNAPLMLSRGAGGASPLDLVKKVLELNKPFTGIVTGFQRVPDPNVGGEEQAAMIAAETKAAEEWRKQELNKRGVTA